MTLFLCFNSLTLTPLSPSSFIFPLGSTIPISRVQLALPSNYSKKLQICTPFIAKTRKNAIFIASASAANLNVADGNKEDESKKEGDGVSVDKLPLESKLKEKEEQRLKILLAKKIRLKRKRLVQKRKLRKKGNWPPSKMKKLKSV